jgi:hypothetical protein
MIGGLPGGDLLIKPLARLGATDLWYRTEQLPVDARFTYTFMHNYVKPAPGEKEEERVQKMMKQARRDPFNPAALSIADFSGWRNGAAAVSATGDSGQSDGGLTTETTPDLTFIETGWLARQYATAPRLPLRFYLEVGTLEQGMSINLVLENRRMRDTLTARGYPVTYSEYNGGHDALCWRGSIADGLIALLGAPREGK